MMLDDCRPAKPTQLRGAGAECGIVPLRSTLADQFHRRRAVARGVG
jgi:hypothetical protein